MVNAAYMHHYSTISRTKMSFVSMWMWCERNPTDEFDQTLFGKFPQGFRYIAFFLAVRSQVLTTTAEKNIGPTLCSIQKYIRISIHRFTIQSNNMLVHRIHPHPMLATPEHNEKRNKYIQSVYGEKRFTHTNTHSSHPPSIHYTILYYLFIAARVKLSVK